MAASVGRFILSVYFYTLFLAASAVMIPALTALVAAGALFSPHRTSMRRFRRSISWYGTVVTSLPYPFIRLRYEDRSGGNGKGPFIFIGNHRSASDPFLMCVLPHECVQIVNIWPFRIPVIGQYARFAGYLNIRMMPHEEFMERAARLLREGVSIIFFPEGTRSANREMGSFHGAAFRLAQATGVPLVPLCITGNEGIPPKGSLQLRTGIITVRRLPAVTREEYGGLTAFALKNRVWNMINDELIRMEGRAA